MHGDERGTAEAAAKAARSARVRAQRAERLAAMVERRARTRGRTGPYLTEARRLRVEAVRHLVDARWYETGHHDRAVTVPAAPEGTRAAA